MAQEAVLNAPDREPQAPLTAQIYAATADAAFAEMIAAALNAEGVEVVTGDYAQSGAVAVIVVWSGVSVGSRRLIAAAQSPLAAGVLIPVSIGRIEPPEAFRRLQPVDLYGWTGSIADPRWRFVVDELRRMAPIRQHLPHAPGPVATDASFESWFDAAFVAEEGARRHARLDAAPAPQPAAAAKSRRRMKPLVSAAAAAGTLVFLAFAGLTVLRQARAPRLPADEAPTLAHIDHSAAQPAGLPADVEAPPGISPAPTKPDRAEPKSYGVDDPIAALIAENSAPRSEPATPAALIVPPTDEAAYFRDCADCPELSRLPPGRFRMGPGPGETPRPGEGQSVEAEITKPFAMARTETTVREWSLCVADGACPSLPGANRPNAPAVNVSWRDAQAYAAWLSKKTGQRYRLPSEAEWEYAARAGADTAFAFGGALSASDAAFDGTLPYRGDAGASLRAPRPVASYAANAFGLFDMHGNAWEWTADCWAPDHAGAPTDGSPRTGACAQRVLKGGAWNTGGWRLRAAHRIGKSDTAREYDNGFRVVRDLP